MVQRGTALVVHVSGEPQDVVGFAVAGPWHSYEGYARTVEDSIYLSPAAQGKGLGARLLAALIEASRRAGDRTMIALIEAVTRPRCACTSAMVSPLSALSRRPARNMVRSST